MTLDQLRWFYPALLLLMFSHAIYAQETRPQAMTAPAPIRLTTAPVLMNPSEDGMTVLVGVSGPSTCWIEYGTTQDMSQKALGSINGLRPYDSSLHKIRVSGLTAGTTYYYRVCAKPVVYHNAYKIAQGDSIYSEIFTFKTLDKSASECSFQAINDTHEQKATIDLIAQQFSKHPADLTVWNGDIFNDIHDEQQMMRQLISFEGNDYAARRPVLIVRGNHDGRGSNARNLPRYIDMPKNSPYYFLRQGPAAIIILDSGEDKNDDHPEYGGMNDFDAYRRQEYQWFREQLNNPDFKSAAWRIVFVHIPLKWKYPERLDGWWRSELEPFQSLLVQGRIDLVVSGHTHNSDILEATQELPYVQVVGGAQTVEKATIIRGSCTADTLEVGTYSLQGVPIKKIQLSRQ